MAGYTLQARLSW